MSDYNKYLGILKFHEQIICKGEALGKHFVTSINGVKVSLLFPVVVNEPTPENFPVPTIQKLSASIGDALFKNVDWGQVYSSPSHVCGINCVEICFSGDANIADSVYLGVQNWLDRFAALYLCFTKKLMPKLQTIHMVQNSDGIADFDIGLSLFLLEDKKLRSVHSPLNSANLSIEVVTEENGLTLEELTDLVQKSSDSRQISQTYLLYAEACNAYNSYNFQTAVILCSAALEQAIVYRVEQHCEDNHIPFEKMGSLGKKFIRLKELKIEIPVSNYKTRIVDIRNDISHIGVSINRQQTYRFLQDCKTIINAYEPDIFNIE